MARVVSKHAYVKATGQRLEPGDAFLDQRGDAYSLVSADGVSTPGRSGYATVADGSGVEHYGYASNWGLAVAGVMTCGCPVGPDHGSHRPACLESVA